MAISLSDVFQFSTFARRSTLALLACCPGLALHAQQTSRPGTPSVLPTFSSPSFLAASSIAPLDLAASAGVTYSSSDASSSANTAAPDFLANATEATGSIQPPPRRRSGRPRYSDNTHNADGSNKYAFILGGGGTIPVGNTHRYLNTSYDLQVGGGRNFNKTYALLAQFDYHNFGFQGSTLTNQQNLYNFNLPPGQTAINGLDGSSHVWSITLDPIVNLHSSDAVGIYAVGGVGFYHKTANFTVPAVGTYCDPYYGCYQYQANQSIDKYISNAVGFNGGLGLTYRLSRFAGERLYAEARYVYMANSQRQGYTLANITTANFNTNNFYPANSNRTTFIPVTVGIRF